MKKLTIIISLALIFVGCKSDIELPEGTENPETVQDVNDILDGNEQLVSYNYLDPAEYDTFDLTWDFGVYSYMIREETFHNPATNKDYRISLPYNTGGTGFGTPLYDIRQRIYITADVDLVILRNCIGNTRMNINTQDLSTGSACSFSAALDFDGLLLDVMHGTYGRVGSNVNYDETLLVLDDYIDYIKVEEI